MFAISFAFISVAVGIFATYDDVLQTAGPVGIWLWVIVAVGQTWWRWWFAQFAARIPLSGSSYQWASRLANPKIGWVFGWLTFCYLAIGVVAVDNALASHGVHAAVRHAPDEDTARLITVVVLLVQAVLVIASTRLAGMDQLEAVATRAGDRRALVIALIIAVVVTGSGSAREPRLARCRHGLRRLLRHRRRADGRDDHGPHHARGLRLRGEPGRGGQGSLSQTSRARSWDRWSRPECSGLGFLIALTIAIKDIPRVTASGSPVAAIIRDQLGSGGEKSFLSAITIAFFGAGMAVMTACSRIVFAMARDARFPAHRLMRRVNPRTQTPIPATILILLSGSS